MGAKIPGKHGTVYRYRIEAKRHREIGKLSARPCRACREAYMLYKIRMKANALAKGDQGQLRHGTGYSYKIYGCKCAECKAWANKDRVKYKRKAAGKDPLLEWPDNPPWPLMWGGAGPCEKCGSHRSLQFSGGRFCQAHRPTGYLGEHLGP